MVHSGSAVFFGQIGAIEAEVGHLADQIGGEGAAFEVVFDDGTDSVGDESAVRVPNEALFIGQEVVDAVKVDSRWGRHGVSSLVMSSLEKALL